MSLKSTTAALLSVSLTLMGCVPTAVTRARETPTQSLQLAAGKGTLTGQELRLAGVSSGRPNIVTVRASSIFSGPETEKTSVTMYKCPAYWSPLYIPLGIMMTITMPVVIIIMPVDDLTRALTETGLAPSEIGNYFWNVVGLKINACDYSTAKKVVDVREQPTGRQTTETRPIANDALLVEVSARTAAGRLLKRFEHPRSVETDSQGQAEIDLGPGLRELAKKPEELVVAVHRRVDKKVASTLEVPVDSAWEPIQAERVAAAAAKEFKAAEEAGDSSRDAGNLAQALKRYLAAYKLKIGADDGARLREKLVGAAANIALEVPSESERHMVRGQVLFKEARDTQGFAAAAAEMEQAIELAPWVASNYFNLGLVQAGAGQYDAAVRNLKLYLVGRPNAPDAKAVQNKIFELEFKGERAR